MALAWLFDKSVFLIMKTRRLGISSPSLVDASLLTTSHSLLGEMPPVYEHGYWHVQGCPVCSDSHQQLSKKQMIPYLIGGMINK